MAFCIRLTAVVLGLTFTCAGCTTMSLERRTVNQIRSLADYRYRETLDCLATVAAEPAALPSYCLVTAGSTKTSDTETLTPTTVWEHVVPSGTGIPVSGFASQALGVTWNRSPTQNWTLVAVTDHFQLEALRCACQWVIYGPKAGGSACAGLLASPEQDPSPGPHFGVANRLLALPPCWLHVGRLKDVPPRASYCGHHGDTWVWVMPDGLEGLADFTLVLLDIATLDTTASTPPQIYITLYWRQPPSKDGSSTTCTEQRVVKPEYANQVAEILFSQRDLRTVDWGKLTTAPPPPRANISPTGPNTDVAALRSVISAEGAAGTSPTRPAFPFAPVFPPSHAFPFAPVFPKQQ